MKKRKDIMKDYLNEDIILKAMNKLEYEEKYGIKLPMKNRTITQ